MNGVQLFVIVVLTAIIVALVLSGLDKGIQIVSRINVLMALVLMAPVLTVGSVGWCWVSGCSVWLPTYLPDFAGMSLYPGDQAWLSSWTIFFFGWFMGYGPLMAICTAVIPPTATTPRFTVPARHLGRAEHPGAISVPLADGCLPAAVMAIASNLRLGDLLATGSLLPPIPRACMEQPVQVTTGVVS